MTDHVASLMWNAAKRRVAGYPPRTFLAYPKRSLPHPREAGARVSVGIPRGQIADYRFPPEDDCRGLHVQEFEDRWEIHLDAVHPACDVVDHLRIDSPGTWVVAGAVLGGAVGAAIVCTKAAVLLGAGIGALLAAATTGRDLQEVRDAKIRPAPHFD